MDFIAGIWESTSITIEAAWAVVGLSVFGLLFFILTVRARVSKPFATRTLPAVVRIRAALGRAMETGEEMHVALGSGRLNDLSAADTLAGLYLVSYLARRGAVAEVPVRVRVADPTALTGALAVLQSGAASAGYPEAFELGQAEFVAPTPLAYGVGVAEGLRQQPMAANAMVGSFGPEVLLPGQVGIERGLVQVGGTSAPAMQPLFLGSTETPLVGEEIYALGAALGRREHTGSLATQDVFRALLAFGILLVTVLGLLGV